MPEDTAALADRLGRYLPADTEPVSQELEEGLKGRAARRPVRSGSPSGLASTAARRGAREPRRGASGSAASTSARPRSTTYAATILVSDTGSQLFAGTLQDAIDPHGRLTREQAEEAVRVAAAEDVYDALPGGWQGVLDERGRGLSGGQRQRVVLARALAADAPILVLVEPTSAVDAHTEARIAERLAAYRRGRTTVVSDGVAAVAAPRRPGGAVRRRPGDRRRHATRSCCATARPTAASSRAPRWTHPWRRCRAMSTRRV